MKSRLFVRPNLKLFFGAALLLLAIVQLTSSGTPQSRCFGPLPVHATGDPQAELQRLLQQATVFPNARAYTQLGLHFERQGDYCKALYYLRKADALAEREEGEEGD
jgi:hypothetical protein